LKRIARLPLPPTVTSRFGDPKRAREAYAKALEYDSEDLEALYWYGYLNFIAGDLGIAQRTLARLLETATARGDQRGIYRAHLVQGQTVSHARIGSVLEAQGNLPAALESHKSAHTGRTHSRRVLSEVSLDGQTSLLVGHRSSAERR
jgi:tetratricopeptide (TPR) repeat protein